MGSERLYGLLEKYRQGKCTQDELGQLDSWYRQFDRQAEHISSVPREKLDQLFLGIENNIRHRTQHKRRGRLIRWSAAACMAVAAVIFFTIRINTPSGGYAIMPGTWKAELITGDGTKVHIDDLPVVEGDGTEIKNEARRGLDYRDVQAGNDAEIYHTVVVPVGSEFGVTLSDGTTVRLNSGSSLTYPRVFGPGKRKVELTGEAYFDVVPSSAAFIVNSSAVEIEVLGTSFNVSAYADDADIITTLVSGRVSVIAGGKAHTLEPGRQLTYDRKTGRTMQQECDPAIAVSWIEGEFKFRDMRLEDIMKKLNRWYACDVVFSDPYLKELRLSGAAEKDRPVGYVLDMIEFITDVRFSVNGNTIEVRAKK